MSDEATVSTKLRAPFISAEKAIDYVKTPSGSAMMSDKLTFTLGAIRDAGPCGLNRSDERTGFRKLLHTLNEPDVGYDRKRRVSLGDVALSNGADDAWWCVRCLDWADIGVRRAVVAVLLHAVRRQLVHTTELGVGQIVDALARWVAGDDTVDLAAAWASAEAAAGDARDAEQALQLTDFVAAFPPLSVRSK